MPFFQISIAPFEPKLAAETPWTLGRIALNYDATCCFPAISKKDPYHFENYFGDIVIG